MLAIVLRHGFTTVTGYSVGVSTVAAGAIAVYRSIGDIVTEAEMVGYYTLLLTSPRYTAVSSYRCTQ